MYYRIHKMVTNFILTKKKFDKVQLFKLDLKFIEMMHR